MKFSDFYKTFKNLKFDRLYEIQEMAHSIEQHCKNLDDMCYFFDEEDMKENFTFIKKIKDLYLYKAKITSENEVFSTFLLFEKSNEKLYRSVYQLILSKYNSTAKKLNLKNLYECTQIIFQNHQENQKYKNQHYPYLIYSELLKIGYNLLGDKYQYIGAQKIWKYLSKEYNVKLVDLFKLKIYDCNIEKVYNNDSNTRLIAFSPKEKIIKEDFNNIYYIKLKSKFPDLVKCRISGIYKVLNE